MKCEICHMDAPAQDIIWEREKVKIAACWACVGIEIGDRQSPLKLHLNGVKAIVDRIKGLEDARSNAFDDLCDRVDSLEKRFAVLHDGHRDISDKCNRAFAAAVYPESVRAERERGLREGELNAHVERLSDARAELHKWRTAAETLERERDDACAEVERLTDGPKSRLGYLQRQLDLALNQIENLEKQLEDASRASIDQMKASMDAIERARESGKSGQTVKELSDSLVKWKAKALDAERKLDEERMRSACWLRSVFEDVDKHGEATFEFKTDGERTRTYTMKKKDGP